MQTNKAFRSYDLGQTLLLPPDLNDWLPEDHLARFVADTLASIDLSAFLADYEDGRGLAAYHPQMMLSVLVYGYCTGVRSSRKLATACQEHVAFRFLSANAMPRHTTFANFRRRHFAAMESLFVEIFQLCREAGLVHLGHVAIDGSKFQANAGRHRAVSWERLEERERYYRTMSKELMEQAELQDATEDGEWGEDGDGSCLPAGLKRAQDRLARLAEAKAALKARARERCTQEREKKQKRLDEIAEQERQTGKKFCGRRPSLPDPEQAEPKNTDQYSFSDPDARLMPDGATKSFAFAYNAQIAADGSSGVIVGTVLTHHANDRHQLIPTLENLASLNHGKLPQIVSADNGYYKEDLLTDKRLDGVDLYIPPNKPGKKSPMPNPAEGGGDHLPPDKPRSPSETMRQKLQTPKGKDVYKMRKAYAEPVFGIIKAAMGFRTFSLRGRAKVAGEWGLVTAAYNLRKLFRNQGSMVMT
ncbi:MAG: IS1182 family transposase [Planctomycetota bacterium]|nr:MAG: IS1182 family transposase [Planctomycetota bacterium]